MASEKDSDNSRIAIQYVHIPHLCGINSAFPDPFYQSKKYVSAT